jgi:3-hydroxyisobutyrate dehydrogenase
MAAGTVKETIVGWIGTGVMGRWMCQHVMDKGYPVVVHSRTRTKCDPLLASGARWADSPAEAARQADIVFTMVGFPSDVREVYLGQEGILSGARQGLIAVDMTTTEPSLAKEIDTAAQPLGVRVVDAPVSGGDIGARNAQLSIMVGGNQDSVEAVRPFLALMGRQIVYQGPIGSGQHTKMCNQIVIAGTMIGVCEALLYGYQAGLNLEQVLKSISGGAAGCWSLTNLAPRILKRNFDPGFFVAHFIKDMGIALEEARRMQLCLPGLALVHQLYLSVAANGGAQAGTQALMLALERLSRVAVDSPPNGQRRS